MNYYILVVEDDKDLREVLQQYLSEAGYLVRSAPDGIKALQMIEANEPDLVMLDLGLPNLKGEMVCKEIKKRNPEIAVIFLTGRDSTSDIVNGLDIGADDYVTKPFELDELLARIKARLRTSPTGNALSIDDLSLNTQTMEVTRGGKEISLTPQEYKILEYLLMNKGRVLTRNMILSRLWKADADIETRVVDVYIGYLRKKIDNRQKKKLIQSVRGFGYKISE